MQYQHKKGDTMFNLSTVLSKTPDAKAKICGGSKYPKINGTLRLYQTDCGTVVASEIKCLPDNCEKKRVFAFHIHEGTSCKENCKGDFYESKGHYNPENTMHPYHAGDMPPLFSYDGYALSVFLTKGFCLWDVIGKTVIIHSGADDLMSQPAGNSGEKIACGVIEKC